MNSQNTRQLQTMLARLLLLLERLDYPQIGKVLLAIFSLATIHFGIYLSTFSLKSVILLDLSAPTRYFFNMAIILAVASGLARFLQFVLVKSCSVIFPIEASWLVTLSRYLKSAMVFYIAATTMFCLFFVGFKRGALAILLILLIHFGFELMSSLIDELEAIVSRRRTLRDVWVAATKDVRALAMLQSLREYATRLWNRGELVLLIVFGVIVFAIARAGYVIENYRFLIGSSEHDAVVFSVFLNTSDGLLVLNREEEEVHFLPWETVGSMKLEVK